MDEATIICLDMANNRIFINCCYARIGRSGHYGAHR